MASEELRLVVDMLRSRPVKEGATVAEMRAGLETLALAAPLAGGVRREPVVADGVPCEWIVAPEATGDGVLLYLHGGAYVLGSINTHRHLVARLSAATGASGLAVDYRLAPEHPFPAAVEDATTAYRWLLGRGTPPSDVVVAGDSAGGGLTVATLVALRDAGDPLPATGVCLCPWVDLEGLGRSMIEKAEVDPLVERAGLLEMAALYLDGADPRTPLAAPLHADLRGLPPLLIQVGTAETLLDDAIRLAARAREAGVEVELDAWEDMIHVWQAFTPVLPEADRAIEAIGRYVRQRLGRRRRPGLTGG